MAENIKGMNDLQKRLRAIGSPRATERMMQMIGLAAVANAKVAVARKTGNLGRSIHTEKLTATSVNVVASAKYAGYVEHGTRPHEITPNAKKALRFAASPGGRRLTGAPRVGASVVFAKRVHHPGTRAQPYLIPGAKKAIADAGADVIVTEWNGAA